MPYRNHYDPDQPRVPAGHHDGGQWMRDGGLHSVAQPAFANPVVIEKGIEAFLALFAWLSIYNNRDHQAVITFKARRFHVKEGTKTEIDRADVDLLSRDEVNVACEKLKEVQRETDAAAEAVQGRPDARDLTPSQYGTFVHSEIQQKINAPNNPDFKAEVSYLKGEEESYPREHYGKEGSIRVDVLENTRKGTVCVYDIKTGLRGLSVARMIEIASNVIREYGPEQRIIITEVRPTR